VRAFLRLPVEEPAPDHSTISRTRRVIDLESHGAVFTWVQQRLVAAGLLKGKTVAVDRHHARCERGHAQHRAPRHRGELSGVLDRSRAGVGDQNPVPTENSESSEKSRVLGRVAAVSPACLSMCVPSSRLLPAGSAASRPVLVCGLLPPQPHASFTRQGLPGPAPGHATQDRKSHRLPASQWPASPLQTSRRLIGSIACSPRLRSCCSRRLRIAR